MIPKKDKHQENPPIVMKLLNAGDKVSILQAACTGDTNSNVGRFFI